MIFLPDVNIWIALTSNRHVHHSLANEWLKSIDSDQIAFCRISELGFLRLLTNAHVMGKDVLSPVEAWRVYDEWRADDRVIFLPEQPLFDRVIQFPGVQAVGVIDSLPVADEGTSAEEHIAGQPQYPKGHAEITETRTVSTGYFDVFGIRLLRGRALSPGLDRPANAAANVVVNEAFVRKFIPSNLDPTVQRMDGAAREENWTHIVGVTGNVRQNIYEDPLAEEDFLMNFYPFSDRPTYLSDMQLVVRMDGDPKRMIPALGSAIHQIDPTVPFKTPESMTEVISRMLVFERMESWLFAIFAALAMTLALVGLYGLINHEVGLCARDIGIRIALGSTRERVMAMILTRVAALLTTGIATGLALTYAAKKLIASVVVIQFGHQGGLLALLVFTLVVAGVIATVIPALRAARTDPMQALRSE